jgi:hypothetical protein
MAGKLLHSPAMHSLPHAAPALRTGSAYCTRHVQDAGACLKNFSKNSQIKVGVFLASFPACFMPQGEMHVETLVTDSW